MSSSTVITKYLIKNRERRPNEFPDSKWMCVFPIDVITNILINSSSGSCAIFGLTNKNLYNFVMCNGAYILKQKLEQRTNNKISNATFVDYCCTEMLANTMINKKIVAGQHYNNYPQWIDNNVVGGTSIIGICHPFSFMSTYSDNNQYNLSLTKVSGIQYQSPYYRNQFYYGCQDKLASSFPRVIKYAFKISHASFVKACFEATFWSYELLLDSFDSLGLIHKTSESFVWLLKKGSTIFLLEYWRGYTFAKSFDLGRNMMITCVVYNSNSNILSLVTNNKDTNKRVLTHIIGSNSWLWDN